ncbi:hypothetical protein PoB_003485900 [Plakobranchus ocellatus]|uniref:G-protein coupled receptors family 1 profile domain-containing protein n=1 Tax=Plakobranchus ocellatus TaxID=259542 RepID=A0AAV4AQB2_9GAST|nr:hypothetical protein PoB_003485900 [Plakobranchus ocellatus]
MDNISGHPAMIDNSSALDATSGLEANSSSGGRTDQPSTEAIIICAILSVFCVLGTVGNALAFLIYYRKRDKGTSTIFILSLAVTDFLTCLISIPYTIATELLVYRHTYDLVCKLYIFLQTMVIPLSSLIMVAIGIDRYFCICHPFMRAVTVPRAKIILVVLTLLSVSLGIVPSLGHSVYYLEERNKTTTVDLADSDNLSFSPTSNGSFWMPSLSDPAFSTVANSQLFSQGSSTPPSYVSVPTSSLSGSFITTGVGGGTRTTLRPNDFFTNGLFLKPNQDFLDSFNGQDPRMLFASTTPAAALQSGGLTTTRDNSSALDNDQNTNRTVTKVITEKIVTYYGTCYMSEVIVPFSFLAVYQKFYAGLYLVEFVILAVLYVLIYRSILVRRAWKAKRKRMSCYASAVNGPAEETQLTQINNTGIAADGAGVNGAGNNSQPTAETVLLNPKKKDAPAGRVSAAMRDRAFYANIRTAAMLFVVTVGFVVSFLPSWLMGLKAEGVLGAVVHVSNFTAATVTSWKRFSFFGAIANRLRLSSSLGVGAILFALLPGVTSVDLLDKGKRGAIGRDRAMLYLPLLRELPMVLLSKVSIFLVVGSNISDCGMQSFTSDIASQNRLEIVSTLILARYNHGTCSSFLCLLLCEGRSLLIIMIALRLKILHTFIYQPT